jgi:hypothetical protein
VSLYDPQQGEAARRDDRLVDEYVRYHFGVEPPEAPAAGQDESVPQAPSEDESFEAYMRTHFPGRT